MRNALLAAMLGAAGTMPMAAHASELDPDRCSPELPSACLNGVSGSVTSLDALRARTLRLERQDEREERRQAGLRPVRVAANGGMAGVMGSEVAGWGIWASAGRADLEGSVAVAPSKGDLDTYTIGVDRLIGERLSLGAMLLNERTSTRTRFNGGGESIDGNTLIVYGSYLINDVFSIDANVGRGALDANQYRIDPASAPGAPLYLVGSYDSDRVIWALTLNAGRVSGPWVFGARLGYQNAREEQDGYRETGGPSARIVNERTVSLEQGLMGADIAYGFQRNWQAYASLAWRHDLSRDDGRSGGGLPNATGATTSSDRDALEWAVGLRFHATARFTAVLEYLRTTGREAYSHDAWMVMARFDL